MLKKYLDEDHFGLKEIKDRILDFISIRKLKTDGYPPIFALWGRQELAKPHWAILLPAL